MKFGCFRRNFGQPAGVGYFPAWLGQRPIQSRHRLVRRRLPLRRHLHAAAGRAGRHVWPVAVHCGRAGQYPGADEQHGEPLHCRPALQSRHADHRSRGRLSPQHFQVWRDVFHDGSKGAERPIPLSKPQCVSQRYRNADISRPASLSRVRVQQRHTLAAARTRSSTGVTRVRTGTTTRTTAGSSVRS